LKVLALSGNHGLTGSLQVFKQAQALTSSSSKAVGGDDGSSWCSELRTLYLTNCPSVEGDVNMLFGLKVETRLITATTSTTTITTDTPRILLLTITNYHHHDHLHFHH
jgi:hypothetical protein